MIEIMDMEQGSDEWYAARLGIPTASKFATVMAKGRGGGESLTRATYMRQLAGEIITGKPMENFQSAEMKRGKIMEEEARNYYAFMKDEKPQIVGFVRNGSKGASPDSLLGDDGLLEIKTSKAEILIDLMLKDKFPATYVNQCQGQLWVTGRKWLDLIVYWPSMPPFIKRIDRDEELIKTMDSAVQQFNKDLSAMVSTIRPYKS